ncbi:MAG: DUF4178 domain-containing protein [Myxococcota bacterium]
MSELNVKQVECVNCGAKIDIRSGLRMKTFACDYCGSVCENDEVRYIQDQHALKQKFAPMSFLKLGLKANFLGSEYQIVGRVRYTGGEYESTETWVWDDWFLISPTGFPLWISEDETGFYLTKIHNPSTFHDPYTFSSNYFVDGKQYKVEDRAFSTLEYIEGELTWRAVPGEVVNYIEAINGDSIFTIEYSDSEVQYYTGEKLSLAQLKEAFGKNVVDASMVQQKKEKKPEKPVPWLKIGIVAFIVAAISFFIFLTLKQSGNEVFRGTVPGRVYVRGSLRTTKFTITDKKTKEKTFQITKGNLTRFTFKSGDFPYHRSSVKEVGWWVSGDLYEVNPKGDDKYITTVNVDFWKAHGYEDTEHWHESKKTESVYLKDLEKGKVYYFKFTAGANKTNAKRYNRNIKLAMIVRQNVWYPKPFLYLAIVLGSIGGIILIIFIAIKNDDD